MKPQESSCIESSKSTITARKKTRKYLFQKLYAASFQTVDDALFDESFFQDVMDFELDTEYFGEMFQLVIEKQQELGQLVILLAPKFQLEKMNVASILPVYIAAAEMLYFSQEIPVKVSVNEAIELAKVYGDDSSKKVVNGMMNTLLRDFDSLQTSLMTQDCSHIYKIFVL